MIATRFFLAACWLAVVPAVSAQHGWVAESANFRVLVQDAPGLDADAARLAASELEMIREKFLKKGLGTPRRPDGPTEFLVVATMLDLHSLIRDPPSSRTRGLTIRDTDRDLAVIPWHAAPGPRLTLAHEYAHQLDDNSWPLWFREGRAVYLARRLPAPSGSGTVRALAELLEETPWADWATLLAARQSDPATAAEGFQAQSWLLVHWLLGGTRSIAALQPEDGDRALAELGQVGLTQALKAHLPTVLDDGFEPITPASAAGVTVLVRNAEEWEIPLLEAEIHRALRFVDSAETRLRDLVARFPGAGRVHAGYGALQLVRGNTDAAETHYTLAAQQGDTRPSTAYRYAILLMRFAPESGNQAQEALKYALAARDASPERPEFQLAAVHGRMLCADWKGAYEELGRLAGFPGWGPSASREAREIQRRWGQALKMQEPPPIAAQARPGTVTVPLPTKLPDWKERRPATSLRPEKGKWPPDGAWLIRGRVSWIDCSGAKKKLILHTRFKRYVFSENPRQPPRLIHPPFKSTRLPCDSRGWVVGVAYRRDAGGPGTDGELLGVRF